MPKLRGWRIRPRRVTYPGIESQTSLVGSTEALDTSPMCFVVTRRAERYEPIVWLAMVVAVFQMVDMLGKGAAETTSVPIALEYSTTPRLPFLALVVLALRCPPRLSRAFALASLEASAEGRTSRPFRWSLAPRLRLPHYSSFLRLSKPGSKARIRLSLRYPPRASAPGRECRADHQGEYDRHDHVSNEIAEGRPKGH